LADSGRQDKPFCDQLYIDAGNWSLLKPWPLDEKTKHEYLLAVAIGNNDCPAPILQDRKVQQLAADRTAEIEALHSDDDLFLVHDKGYGYGVNPSNCPEIEKYAAGLVTKAQAGH
jgi:hypothetical protein